MSKGSQVKTLTLAEVHEAFKAQGVSSHRHYATICPICGTVQSMASLVAAGAEPGTVERRFGFSCEGRLTDAGPFKKGSGQRGCDWTLGGLFQFNKAEVLYPDGTRAPMFEVATPQ